MNKKTVLSMEDMAERYNIGTAGIEQIYLPLGLPYRKAEKSAEMTFDPAEVTEWEMKVKCVGCGKGLPGCGLLPAYRSYLFGRKKNPGKIALFLICFLLSIYQCVFTPHVIAGYAALTVFSVLLYDQNMRKGGRHVEADNQ